MVLNLLVIFLWFGWRLALATNASPAFDEILPLGPTSHDDFFLQSLEFLGCW